MAADEIESDLTREKIVETLQQTGTLAGVALASLHKNCRSRSFRRLPGSYRCCWALRFSSSAVGCRRSEKRPEKKRPEKERVPLPKPGQARREWMGVEPTAARSGRPATDFEDQGIHRDTTTPQLIRNIAEAGGGSKQISD